MVLSIVRRLALRLPQRNITTVTTNVPGPRQPLYARGRRMPEVIPYVPIATTARVGIAIMSYRDTRAFEITADYDSTLDIDVLVRAIEDSLAEFVAAA